MLKNLLKELKLKYSEKHLIKIINELDFQAQTGRNKGTEDKKSFLRKGISGDWKNYFDKDITNAFVTEMDGRWNKILVKLGYEDSINWYKEYLNES